MFGGSYKFTIDDGYQLPITLLSKDRLLIAATFSKYILSSIGEVTFVNIILIYNVCVCVCVFVCIYIVV